jgi:HSP20 family protein
MPVETAAEPLSPPMQRQMNKIMDQLQKGFFGFSPRETWTPSVNLYETRDCYVVCVDLAGVVKEKIDLSLVQHRLTLRGTRAVPEPEAPCHDPQRPRVHLMEIDHGPFCRQVDLPENILHEKIAATYRDGLLWITLPKKAG